jgi:2-succinyl-6-hydroxy-2,4-cyclohexadiene-1-carboxylate synthase
MMHVEVSAAGRGPLLLLVHGICSSRAQWRLNLDDLGEFCTPVVVELLGHGRSESPADPNAYRVEAYVARFEALRAELGAERWAICGQSFGAGLTLNYALAHPDRVIGQVFTNSNSALAPAPATPAVADEVRRERAAAFERRGRAALEAMPFYPKRTGRLTPAVEDELVRDAELIDLAAFFETLRTTTSGLSVAGRLAEIAVPTLLVNGVREKTFQPFRDQAAATIPGLQVVDLDGGHPINLDRPAEFTTAVRAFLASCR